MSLLRRPWDRLTGTGESLSRAIYGTVLTMAIVAGLSTDRHIGLGLAAVTLLAECTVFWLAHVYADLLGRHLDTAERGSFPTVALQVMRTQMPLLEAALIPALVLAIGWAGALSVDASYWLALTIGAAELTLWGVLYARAVGYGAKGQTAAALINLLMGLVIVALKVVIT